MDLKDRLFSVLMNKNCSLSISQIAKLEHLNYLVVKKYMDELYNEGKVSKIKGLGNEDIYRYRYSTGKAWAGKKMDEMRMSSGIWPQEIKEVIKNVQIGCSFKYLDNEGGIRKTKVIKKYPYICRFDNGQSYTWVEIAIYCRDKKNQILD